MFPPSHEFRVSTPAGTSDKAEIRLPRRRPLLESIVHSLLLKRAPGK